MSRDRNPAVKRIIIRTQTVDVYSTPDETPDGPHRNVSAFEVALNLSRRRPTTTDLKRPYAREA